MHAVVMHETGGPEVLHWEEADDPTIGDGEVLVRMDAASVNPIDWKERIGATDKALPGIPGRDGSGTVQESKADGFSPGDEVFGWLRSGAYAELAAADAGVLARRPEGISTEVAAALPVAGATAWQALFEAGGLESGQTALVAGAAGGVGHLAVQFASNAGARVIGTGSSRNHDFVLGLGADQYVDYTQEDVAEAASDVDVVFDTVGGDVTATLVPTLREGGVIVTIASAPPEEAARERGARALLHVTRSDPEQIARIADMLAAGDVRVELAEVLPITDVSRAHELSESGHVRGKIVLTMPL